MEPIGRTISLARPGGGEIDRLKSLLFKPETQKLSSLEFTVETLDQRLGTPDRLELATAQVLVEALRRAEVARHRELSEAIAPVVVAAIRNEIKNSRDMMVEALYPITGRLVSAGIAVAMAELAANINARMDKLLSVEMLKLRFKAWRSGRPLSELALAQSQRGQLIRLLHLERGSGQLLGQWQMDQGENANAELVSGMIAALTDFAHNALGESGGQLRNLDLGGRNIYLRSSARTIIAAEFAGELSAREQRGLDAAFLDLLEANAGEGCDPQAALRQLAVNVAQTQGETLATKRRRLSPLHYAAMLLLAGLAFWGYFAWQRWRMESRVTQAIAQVVAAHPQLLAYPVYGVLHHKAKSVRLTGLVPTREDQDALNQTVAAAAQPYELQSTLAIVSTQPRMDEISAAYAALEQKLAKLTSDTRELQGQLASDTAATRTQLAERVAREAGALTSALHGEIATGLTQAASQNAQISAEMDAKLQLEVEVLTQGLTAANAELAKAKAKLTAEAANANASNEKTIAELRDRLNAPLARLDEELRGFAVFFQGSPDLIEDEPAVREKLATIVVAANAAGGIRVVGHSDSFGTAAANLKISRQRAEMVAKILVELGLDNQRIVLAPRADNQPLAAAGEAGNARSRRVTLEALYLNEIKP